MWLHEMVGTLAVLEHPKKVHGYPGFDTWCASLVKKGVAHQAIVRVDMPEGVSANTYTEAEAFARAARDHKWKCVYCLASIRLRRRAFVSFVGAQRAICPHLVIVNANAYPQPWSGYVRASQGTQIGILYEIFGVEFEKLGAYTNLPTMEEVHNYLIARDQELTLEGI